jgi:hypothetical protein
MATILLLPHSSEAAPVKLNIKIIHAHNDGDSIDPKLEKLVKNFSNLSFTAYELKDEASFDLEIGSRARMQLPNGQWMVIVAKDLPADGKLRLQLSVAKLKFKSTVSIAAGATVAVGGLIADKGRFLLAVTRPK